jgi:spore maturation protein SpmB
MGAMLLNLSANMLGLANAATPFGLRAMESLDRLNGKKGTATNAMILFLALNTAGITALPVSTIVVRASAGSQAPGIIILPTLIATLISATLAVLVALALQRLPWVKASEPPVLADDTREEAKPVPPLNLPIALFGFGGLAAAAGWLVWRSDANKIASGLLPLVAASMLVFGLSARVRVYESAVAGAKGGFEIALRILPYLVIVLVAVALCRASGLLPWVVSGLAHLTTPLGLPAEVVPQVIMRPLSASGTIAILSDTLKANGADSFVGYLASVLYGSSETTFYILSVYFGVVAVQRMRHALVVCLLADAFGVAVGTVVAHLFFRS